MPEWLKKLDIVGLILVLGAGVYYTVDPVWTTRLTAAVVLGAVLLLVSIAARWGQIRSSLRRRSTRFGANSITSIVLLLGVLGFVNYLGVQNEARFDFTTSKLYSLSEQSVAVLDQLVEDVDVRAFYPQGEAPAVESLLEMYGAESSNFSYELVDPDRQPQLAAQFDVTVYGSFGNPLTGQETRFGTLILEMQGATERIEKESEILEEDVTNALTKLIKGETKTIYFVQGHGEKQLDDTGRSGLDFARAALERENYVVESLSLVGLDRMPEDASVVVWPGPEVEPFDTEIDLVDAYLNQGGSVLVMVDPPPMASLGGLLDRWSVSTGRNLVVDASGLGQLFGAGPEIPLVADYPSHAITERFGLMTVFPRAQSVASDETAEGLSVTELLRTGERSWGETDVEALEVAFDEGQDLEGPVTIGLAVTKDLTELEEVATARLLVVGDSDFATNTFFDVQGNGNLFLNAVSWLAEDEGFIAIRPKQPDDRPLNLTLTEGRIVTYVSLALLPLSILGAGVSVWMKRRKR